MQTKVAKQKQGQTLFSPVLDLNVLLLYVFPQIHVPP